MMSQVVSIFTGKQFNLDDIEKLVDVNGACWFKRAHVGNFLGITNWIYSSTKKLSEEDKKERQNIYISPHASHTGWKGDSNS